VTVIVWLDVINSVIDQELYRGFKCTYKKGGLKRVGPKLKASVSIASNMLHKRSDQVGQAQSWQHNSMERL
jgi:hypothetical protein